MNFESLEITFEPIEFYYEIQINSNFFKFNFNSEFSFNNFKKPQNRSQNILKFNLEKKNLEIKFKVFRNSFRMF